MLTSGEERNLSVATAMISMAASQLLQASLVRVAADLRFGADPEHKLFVRNPANTLTYSALKALEDRSIVDVSEQLKNEHGMIPSTMVIRRKDDLLNHRDVLSHSNKIKWGRKGLQEFFDSGKQWTDLRAALVFDMWLSIDEQMHAAGAKPQWPAEVPAGHQQAALLHVILRHSMTPDAAAALPNEEGLLAELVKLRDQLVVYMKQRPDGVIG